MCSGAALGRSCCLRGGGSGMIGVSFASCSFSSFLGVSVRVVTGLGLNSGAGGGGGRSWTRGLRGDDWEGFGVGFDGVVSWFEESVGCLGRMGGAGGSGLATIGGAGVGFLKPRVDRVSFRLRSSSFREKGFLSAS